MSVVQFPGSSAPGPKSKESKPKLILNEPITFTCVNCFNTSVIKTENMIFRTIEFYCAHCGHYHKVTNPAFGVLPIIKKNQK